MNSFKERNENDRCFVDRVYSTQYVSNCGKLFVLQRRL